MSTSSARAARQSYEELGHGTSCEHCDDSVPHEHVDVRGLVEASRAGARRRALGMTVTGAAALVLGLTAAVLLDGMASALTALSVTTLGWLLITALALVVTARAGGATPRGVAAGALTTGGLTPLVPLAVALSSGTWSAAAVAGAAWLAAGAVTAALQARAWRALLLAPGRAGEHARATAVRHKGATGQGEARRWLVQGALVGAATALLVAVPVAVVVLLPTGVLLAAWSAGPANADRGAGQRAS